MIAKRTGPDMAEEINLIGKRIGNYYLIEKIGSGSFGTVYRAQHVHLISRIVALKILHVYLLAKERERVIRDFQILASLQHPHILSIVDLDFDDDTIYLVSEYALGGSLHQRLDQKRLLSWDQTLSILTQVGEALHYAHQQNIVHRDLKPANILFNAQGETLLADFGMAMITESDSVEGPPAYMAPEQFRGQISKETDQYALGCIAYEMVTGQRPFRASTFLLMATQHMVKLPIPPRQLNTQIPVHVEQAILKALAKERSDRHRDIPAFLKALRTTEKDNALVEVVEDIQREIGIQKSLTSFLMREITPEQIMASLPSNVQDAAVFGKTAPLRSALEEYHAKHLNERLAIRDNDEFAYYENIVQATYIWQVWQIISEFVSSRKISLGVPLFQELLSFLCLSLNVSENAPLKQDLSSLFFFTALNTEHLFTNLNVPRQIPVIFYTAPSFDVSHKHALQKLLAETFPSSRIAIMLFFTEPKYLRESQRFLKQFQQAYAYDIIPMACTEFLKITESQEPRKIFRQWILSQSDLSVISPYKISGPTPKQMFFGRERELRTIRDQVHPASYALVGGRRIGKTSILRHLSRISLPQVGIRAFYQDCSYSQTQADLVMAVSHDRTWFSVPPSTPFSSFADMIQALPDDRPIVLLLDEADKLIKPDKAAGYPLFNTLRALSNAGRCQFVFGGEYALLSDMKDPGSPLYNFANVLLVGHLDARAVRELIIQPMHDLEIELAEEDKIVECIWTFTAGHPNVVQRLCQRLVMRINETHRLHLDMEDVESVVTNVDFLRNDFLDTYWGQATVLERLCTLIMVKQRSIRTLVDIHAALSELVSGVILSDVDEALARLVNLRNLLQRTPQGYIFAVEGFPQVFARTYELDDLIALTCDKYKVSEAQN